MKKYFLSIVALAGMLFATSCQESLVEPQVGGPTTFTVQVPDQMGTKAGEDSYKLFVEVYSAEGDESYHRNEPIVMAVGTPTTVTLNLVANQAYDIIFWAQKNDVSYGVDDLSTVQMNANHHNSETGAAFYAVLNNYNPTQGKKDVKLTRPFAQLNLYTTNDVAYGKVNLVKSTITIEGVAEKFNRVDNEIFGEGVSSATYTYTSNILPTGIKTIDGVEYQYVSMDYLAVPGNQNLVNVTAVIDVMDEKGNQSQITRIIDQVPVQMNYRTNIIGNLITSASDFKVEISEVWGGDDNNVVKTEVSTAAELKAAIENTVGGEIVLTDDIELTESLVFGMSAGTKSGETAESDYVLDLNGRTITGTMPKSVGAVIKNNGILTIKNGTISSTAANGGSAISNYGTLNVMNATINGASKRENESWPSYPVNNYSDATFENVLVNGYQGAIACNAAGTTTLTECTINKEYLNTSSHVFYISHVDAEVVVNSGTYTHKGMDGSLAYNMGKITVNGGTFSVSGGGYGMASLSGGSIEVNGGDFTASFVGWGGTINIKGGTFASNPKEDFIAEGYKAVEKDGKFYVVEGDVDIVITDPAQLTKEVIENNETIYLAAGEYIINLYDIEHKTRSLTIVGTEGTKFGHTATTGGQLRLDLFDSFTIRNCEIIQRSGVKTWGHIVFGSGIKANGVYTIENCTFNGVGTQGIYINENTTGATYNILNCTFNGDFGGEGAITIQTNEGVNHIVNVEGCEFNNIPATSHRIFLAPNKGLFYDFTLNTDLKATTDNELVMFLNLSNQVNVAKGNYKFPTSSIKEGQTIICEEGTVFEGQSSLYINGSTVIGATFKNENGYAVRGTIHGTFKNCEFIASEALRWCYSEQGKPVVFEDCVIKTDFRGFHFDDMNGDVIFRGCEIAGFNAFGGDGTITFEGCTFTNDESRYNGLNIYANTYIKDCTFKYISGKTNFIDMEGIGKTLTIENSSATLDGSTANITDFVGGSKLDENFFILDGNYCVKTATSFKNICTVILADGSKNVTIELANDIDLAGIEWPAVKTAAAFVLDGKGYSIKNLTTSAVEDHGFYSTAMFTSTRKATTIKNLVVENATVTGKGGDNSHGAVLVACNYAALNIEGVTVKNSTVSNCDRSSVITTYLYFTNATVKNCVVEGCTVNSIGTAGALLGMNNGHNFEATGNTVKNTTISSSEGSNKAGILIGTWQNAGTLTESNNVVENSKAINAGTETNNNIGRLV